MTVTDAMVEAVWSHNQGSALITEQCPFAEINGVWRRAIRAALEAAIAVMPVPTDAEIERAIDRLELATIEWARSNEPSRTTASTGPLGDKTVELHDALLRLIAAQREAAVREALEAVREYVGSARLLNDIINQKGEPRFWPGVGETRVALVRHIDAMLTKEAGNE